MVCSVFRQRVFNRTSGNLFSGAPGVCSGTQITTGANCVADVTNVTHLRAFYQDLVISGCKNHQYTQDKYLESKNLEPIPAESPILQMYVMPNSSPFEVTL